MDNSFQEFCFKREEKHMVRAGRECESRASFVFLWWEIEHVCLLMAMISREGGNDPEGREKTTAGTKY